MASLKRWMAYVRKNKYVFLSSVFFIWVLLFDNDSIFRSIIKKKLLNKLEHTKQVYQNNIAQINHTLENLKGNTAALEKYARENYYFKKNNETIFIIEDSTALDLPKK